MGSSTSSRILCAETELDRKFGIIETALLNAEESELEQIEFFCDTGAVAQQMTASEITINIITEEELA